MPNTLRERALRLLARREYARSELARKLLATSGEAAPVLNALLDELSAEGLLSDQRYCETRVALRGRKFGDARLAGELRAQGLAGDLVEAALAAGEDEVSRARRLWQRRFAGQSPTTADPADNARQVRFLAARGFSSETIRRVLRGNREDD
ncbi:MAG TPA: regulatory protein RecX [Accumulibacter sp.]|uniref:regulatory protein RecX n=1 Tax=Accumulibacter sp. TaxID=2053492 RepID=UPI002621E4F2|nr:regulatory protein RecX [Accumulibacter sp.]HNL97089.1 regulatory protein RecX [Accumulibacter sp.]HNM64364.1 regulatory protein RecX [Accumulibacter sp.]